ncbi:MAG: hypothetical protein WC102_04815 [Saccharofermentanales bacterium]
MQINTVNIIAILNVCLLAMFFCEMGLFYITEKKLSDLEVKLIGVTNAQSN